MFPRLSLEIFSFQRHFEVCIYGLDQNCDENRNALYLYYKPISEQQQ
jgi:hypothetical protein